MKYDYIIRGATCYGCGMAAGLKGNVLVLEESVVPGSDWALGFDAGYWEEPLVTKPALDFKEALLSHQALSEDGRFCIGALAPLMAKWCLDYNVRIEFSCNVLSYSENIVSVIGVDGQKQYETEHFIDARPSVFNGKKYATGLVLFKEASLPMGTYGDFILTPGLIEGEYYIALPLPCMEKWPEARLAFHAAWDNRPPALAKAQLQLIGVQFSYGNAPNPAAAIEYGYLWSQEVLQK